MEFEQSFFKAGCQNMEIFRLRPPSLPLRWSALKMTGSWFVQGRRMGVLGVLWIGLRRQIGVLPLWRAEKH